MLLAGVVLLSTGCVRSLHPLYTDKDLVFDAALVGQWGQEGEKETWVFSRADENRYRLDYTDEDGKLGRFKAHLLQIDGERFLDFFPEKPSLQENDFYRLHLMPVHTFAHVRQIEPTLQMRFPNPKWMKKYLNANPGAIRHEIVDVKEVVLTAAPKELQGFWRKHLDTRGAFGEPSDMRRQKTPSPAMPSGESAESGGAAAE